MLMASARLRTPSQRNSMLKLSPPRMMWRWLSMRPGRTRRPLRSTTLDFGPASAIISLSAPTARKRPSRIATAVAVGCERASVVKSPRCRIRSALGCGLVMCSLWFGVDLGLRHLLVTSGQEAENVRRALRLAPRGGDMRALHHALRHRDDLLADENAEQPNQRHHGRRRRS